MRDHLFIPHVTYFLFSCLWPGIYGSGRLDTTAGCFWLYCIYSRTDIGAALTSLWHAWSDAKIHLVAASRHQSEVRNHMHENRYYITIRVSGRKLQCR